MLLSVCPSVMGQSLQFSSVCLFIYVCLSVCLLPVGPFKTVCLVDQSVQFFLCLSVCVCVCLYVAVCLFVSRGPVNPLYPQAVCLYMYVCMSICIGYCCPVQVDQFQFMELSVNFSLCPGGHCK